MSVRMFSLAAFAVVVGCAAGGRSGPPNPRRANQLTAEEISSTHADNGTAYDAVARLRPNWLAAHGITSGQSNGAGTEYATVFVDGQEVGPLNALKNISAYQIGDVRYYNVAEAGARFGLRAGASGAIEVLMKSPNRR
jgi:hypothetical protein